MKKLYVSMAFLIILSFVIGILAYPSLPAQVPIHWNVKGQVDGYGERYMIFLAPVIMAIITPIMIMIKRIDPRRKNYAKFENVFQSIILGVNLLMFALLLCTLITCFYPNAIDVTMVLNISVGILFVVLGNLMPRVRQNYFMGYRTPWTLSDEVVWAKTNRCAGYVFFISGICMIIAAFVNTKASLYTLIFLIPGLLIIPIIYSYLIYRKRHTEEQ